MLKIIALCYTFIYGLFSYFTFLQYSSPVSILNRLYIEMFSFSEQISQREIAERLNIKPQGLTKLLNKKNFGFEDAQKILSAIGYDLIIDFQQSSIAESE